jgi:hypothetical protein
MAAVALPRVPKEAQIKERFIDFGAQLTPVLGGAGQYVARLGSRFGLDVQLPKLGAAADDWIAARLQAKTETKTLSLVWPQRPFNLAVGSPVVDGDDQAGARLNVKGFTPGLVLPRLTFFSLEASDRYWLYATTAEATVAGGGTVQLHIAPMLRRSPPDEAVLEFAEPVIEGFVEGSVEWDLERLRWRGTSFTLVENE